jgi:hypothetical protein
VNLRLAAFTAPTAPRAPIPSAEQLRLGAVVAQSALDSSTSLVEQPLLHASAVAQSDESAHETSPIWDVVEDDPFSFSLTDLPGSSLVDEAHVFAPPEVGETNEPYFAPTAITDNLNLHIALPRIAFSIGGSPFSSAFSDHASVFSLDRDYAF